MHTAAVQTFWAQIYLGLRPGYSGQLAHIEDLHGVVQDICNEDPICVTVTPTRFVYRNGSEPGAIIGLINYPRFPSTAEKLEERALTIATTLKDAFGQQRVSVMFPDKTIMLGPVDD